MKKIAFAFAAFAAISFASCGGTEKTTDSDSNKQESVEQTTDSQETPAADSQAPAADSVK